MSWHCSCGYVAGDYDVVCSKCGSGRPRVVVADVGGTVATTATADLSSSGSKTGERYRDAYRVACALVGIGTTLKGVGIIGAIIITLIAAMASQAVASAAVGLLAGLVFGGIWFGLFFVLGILVSAQGQILRATLDTAVNTSPFLTNEDKARVIDLT